jgi:hypothetical protein
MEIVGLYPVNETEWPRLYLGLWKPEILRVLSCIEPDTDIAAGNNIS